MITSLYLAACLVWAAPVALPIGDDPPTADMMGQETRDAIDRGLEWLARTQREDGSFGTGGYAGNIAVTALAGLAYMTAGHMPGQGPYG